MWNLIYFTSGKRLFQGVKLTLPLCSVGMAASYPILKIASEHYPSVTPPGGILIGFRT